MDDVKRMRAGHVPREASDHFFDFFIMAIRADVADLGLALLPRVPIEQEVASGQLMRIGGYAAINAQKTYLIFSEQRHDWTPFARFASWLEDDALSHASPPAERCVRG